MVLMNVYDTVVYYSSPILGLRDVGDRCITNGLFAWLVYQY